MSLNLSEHSTEYVREILKTQLFQNFVEERCDCPHDPEVLFFDDTINAKFNRSKKATLTLRKKETAFLDDTRSIVSTKTHLGIRLYRRSKSYFPLLFQVTETFTPPPPSNFGLPDDGRSYQYSTFPPLNPNFYGKVRTPGMKWNEPNRQASIGAMRRRTSILAGANEHAVVEKATRSLLHNILPKRRPRNLEGALKVLSSPFHLSTQRMNSNSSHHRSADAPVTSRDRSSSAVSSVTLPSEFDSTDEALLTTAEQVVLIARRKHAILIGILTTFQLYFRQHYQNKQRVFVSIKGALVSLQAIRRGMLVRFAFWMLRQRIAQFQALFRGYRVRRLCTILTQVRMQLYKKQIFLLWQKSYTPLSYRSQFWQIFNSVSLVRLVLVEQELLRLWSLLRIQPSHSELKTSCIHGTGIPLGSTYQKALQVTKIDSFLRGSFFVAHN
jgi:DENN domain-containing protein 5